MSDETKTENAEEKPAAEQKSAKVKNVKPQDAPIDVTGLSLRTGPAGNLDYIEFGSAAHAHILNLRAARTGDYIVMGDEKGREWTMTDVTAFPPGTTENYLRAVLAERLRILCTVPAVPKNAPELWKPTGEVRGLT